MKLTTRQAEVMENLSRITSDGSRYEPIYRLNEKNVSVQVRSLINFGLIALIDGRLSEVEQTAGIRLPSDNAAATVTEMRELLGGTPNVKR